MYVIVPYLMGGLGNWMFQIASALFFAQQTGNQCYISYRHCQLSPHSNIDYLRSIFRKFPRDQIYVQTLVVRQPPKAGLFDAERYISIAKGSHTMLYGYFQNWRFIPDNFKDYLVFENPEILKKYPDIQERCFIHVRGGDYVNDSLYYVDLSEYYKYCIQHVKNINKFAIFTNDIKYCKQQEFLKDIDYIIVEENELDSLYLMTQCAACIVPNSTFSWWGAFLNRNRPIYLPSKWFNDPEYNVCGYFFPNCIIVQV